MNAESPLLRFAEFYLSPIMSRKSLDLLKLKLVKPALKNEDPGLVELRALRELSLTMGKKRKSLLSDEERQSTLSPEERELYSLDPEEALLLATQPPFLIPLKSLSLAFGSPEESLRFRVRSLLNRLEDTGTLLSSWNTSLPSREIQPPSVRRRGSWIESFRGLPVGLRFTIETSFILSGLMILLWLIPEIRNRYETSIQRRINDYLIESSLLDAPAPEGTSKTPRTPIETPTEAGASESDMPVNRSSSEEPSARKQPKVNEGETWRFSFTGSDLEVLSIRSNQTSDRARGDPVRFHARGRTTHSSQDPARIPGLRPSIPDLARSTGRGQLGQHELVQEKKHGHPENSGCPCTSHCLDFHPLRGRDPDQASFLVDFLAGAFFFSVAFTAAFSVFSALGAAALVAFFDPANSLRNLLNGSVLTASVV
jgi:hypothetical protein